MFCFRKKYKVFSEIWSCSTEICSKTLKATYIQLIRGSFGRICRGGAKLDYYRNFYGMRCRAIFNEFVSFSSAFWHILMRCVFEIGPILIMLCGTRQVLGCHAKHKDKELWPFNYPDFDGNRCHCYNFFGTFCTATCASNVINHEVRSQYGTGAVSVQCSAGNYVLGCGMKPRYKRSEKRSEDFRTWAVTSTKSCECYDFYGITCYAICGKLT